MCVTNTTNESHTVKGSEMYTQTHTCESQGNLTWG